MKESEALVVLETIASDQWGIVTTSQADREGVPRWQVARMVERGDLRRIRHGVSLLPSHLDGPLTEVRAAWLSLDTSLFIEERWAKSIPEAVSHQSAASVHGLGRMIPSYHFFSSVERKQTKQTDIRIVRRRDLVREDVVSVDGLPVTSIERTVGDLAGIGIERGYLSDVVADALRKEGVKFQQLAHALDPSASKYRAESGEQLVSQLGQEGSTTEDVMERKARFVSLTDGLAERMNERPAFNEVEEILMLKREIDKRIAELLQRQERVD